jgi:2-keto-3-deoxy-6-phosphogluconate aldolase
MIMQIIEAGSSGALFVSTMFNSKSLIDQTKKCDMPILCGVSTLEEAKQSLLWGAEALKFYPASDVKPKALANIINCLKIDGSLAESNVTDIIVAGGVSEADFGEYVAAGATNFAIGFDCKKMTPRQISLKLKELNKLFASVRGSR